MQGRIIISGAGDWRYVDVVHKLAGKLEALEWVRQVYGVPMEVRAMAQSDRCQGTAPVVMQKSLGKFAL